MMNINDIDELEKMGLGVGSIGKSSKEYVKQVYKLEDLDQIELTEEGISFVAVEKLEGFEFKAVYENGKIEKVYCKGKEEKQLSELLITSIKNNKRVTVEGIISLNLSDYKETKNKYRSYLSYLDYLVKNLKTELLSIQCYGLSIDGVNIDVVEQYKYLKEEGFILPLLMNAKGVSKDKFNEYICEVIRRFDSVYDKNKKHVGIYITSVDEKIKLMLKMGRRNKVYKSTIREIKWIYENIYITPIAIIDEIEETDEIDIKINEVFLISLGVLQRFKLGIGGEVYFKVDENMNAVCCRKEGQEITYRGVTK